MLMTVDCAESAKIVPLQGWYFMPLNKTDYDSVRRGLISAVYEGILEGNLQLFIEADTQVRVEFNKEELSYSFAPHVLPYLIINNPARISDHLCSESVNRINNIIRHYTSFMPGIVGKVTEDNQIYWRPGFDWLEESEN